MLKVGCKYGNVVGFCCEPRLAACALLYAAVCELALCLVLYSLGLFPFITLVQKGIQKAGAHNGHFYGLVIQVVGILLCPTFPRAGQPFLVSD